MALECGGALLVRCWWGGGSGLAALTWLASIVQLTSTTSPAVHTTPEGAFGSTSVPLSPSLACDVLT